ncbi:NUDIX hydrolase [Streptosporangium sp. NBC_01755]|uniref:NUDIX hydrolase n=1 Tax=Streptosporangium sp. NBC_01755 TaxID=2975949 RepID=UPI002DD7CF94|nr:NUDIX hydrolase [Streptosporangium sp. NBC_01755]
MASSPTPGGGRSPSGRSRTGKPAVAAAREVEKETSWRPGPLRPLVKQPTNGSSDSVHHIFRTDSTTYIGPPTEGWEAERVEWVPLGDIPWPVGKGDIVSGTGMAALLYTSSPSRRRRLRSGQPTRRTISGSTVAGQHDGSRPGIEREPSSEICGVTPWSELGPSGRRPTRTGHPA